MTSRQPPAAFGRTVLCLPFVKFSFATVQPNMTTIPWSHVTSADLFVLLEHVSSTADPNLQLRIVEGSNTLEKIDLSHLVMNAQKIKQAYEDTSGSLSRVEQLPIFGMTKENAIAIRYNTPNAQSRRTQMTFNNDSNRKELLNMLKEAGLIVINPIPRPTAAQPHMNVPQHSPVTTSVPLPLPEGPAHDRARFANDLASTMQPPIVPSSIHSFTRSQSSPLYHEDTADSFRHPRQHSECTERSDRQTTLESPARISTPGGESSHMTQSLGRHHSGGTESQAFAASNSTRPPSIHHAENNCTTTPVPDLVTLHDLLPPRRQLPFGKSSSSNSGRGMDSANSKSLNPSNDLPPLPKPTFAGEQTSARAQFARTHTDLHPSKRDNNPSFGDLPNATIDERSNLALHSTKLNPPFYFEHPTKTDHRPGQKFPGYDGGSGMSIHTDREESLQNRYNDPNLPDPNAASFLKPYDSVVSHSPDRSRPETSDGRHSSSSSPLCSLSDRSPIRDSVMPRPSVVLDSGHEAIHEFDRILANPKFPANSSDKQQLAAYAAQPSAERIDVLNSLICDYLEDENFRTLCTDIEGAWRWRILGERATRDD